MKASVPTAKRFGRRAACMLLALACLAGVAAARDSAGASLTATVEPGEWTVGDRIGLTLVLVYPPELTPALPELGGELGPFEVLGVGDGGSLVLEDGRREQTWRCTISAWEPGPLEIPPVSVALSGGEAGTTKVSSEPVPLTLVSVLDGEAGEIADLRPPADVPYSYLPVLLWSLAVLAALAALLWSRVWWIRRRGAAALVDEASLLPPRELAIRELQRLTASDLLKHDRFKAFYIAISGIIDRLLHGALGVPTVERTTGEIMRDLRERAPGTPLVPAAAEFYQACDLVKFSRHVPGDAENSAIITAAYRLVDLAAPEPAPGPGDGEET